MKQVYKHCNINYSRIKSCMFVPGSSEKMLMKSVNINSDIIVPDLEDSVALNEKINARINITKHFDKFAKGKLIFPRVNSIASNLFESDLDSILTNKINGLVIPKLNTPEEYKYILNIIKQKEKQFELETLRLIIWIESSLGIMNVKDIFSLNEDKRIIGAAFGAEDFCNDLGIERELNNLEVPRTIFAMAANAYNIVPFDTPNVDFKNPESIINEIKYVKTLGFKGKFAIHPSQVDLINIHFSPSEKEIKNAKLIIEEYEKGLKLGKGAIEVNGKMVDVPVYKRALNTLDRI
jgi:citrate lyase beta subunit